MILSTALLYPFSLCKFVDSPNFDEEEALKVVVVPNELSKTFLELNPPSP